MNKDYQMEQLRRLLENPALQSGLYLIDTDLEDGEIEKFVKETSSCSYVTAPLMPTKEYSTFDLFVLGLSYQCNSSEVKRQRDQFLTIEKGREALVYSLSILVVRELCSNGKSVLHVQGDMDLDSLDHEDIWKLKDALAHHNIPVVVVSKCKRASITKCDSNIILLSFKEENKFRLMENRLSKVYISYKHDAAYEEAIEAIKAGLTKNRIAFSIDVLDIKYRDNIEEYEKEIGKAERVIMFVTATYLKSIDCMFEMTRIFGNKNVKERVFPVVDLKPISRDGAGFKQVEGYWQSEKDKKLDAMKGIGNTVFLQGEIVKINDILKFLNEFWDYLVHVNTGSYEQLTANEAALLMEELQKVPLISPAPLDENVIPSDEVAPDGHNIIEQFGKNNIVVKNNSGTIIIK